MVQRVPAAGSGAPGGVKRRALEALTELKWAGKPGADSSVARPSPPTPLFVGEGTGTAGVSVPGSRHPPTEETGVRRSPRGTPAGLAGPGGAGRAGQPLLCQRAHRRGRARGGGEPPEPAGGWEERDAHACGGSARPAPLPERLRSSPPPTSLGRHLRVSPAARALSSGEVAGPARPLTITPSPQFRPASAELRYKLRCQGLGFSIPASALSLSLPTLEHFLQTARLRCRCCFPLRARHHPVPRLPLLSLLHFTDGELKVDPWEFCFFQNEARELPSWKGKPRLSTI